MHRKHPPGPVNFNAGIGLTWRHGVSLWWNPIRYATWLGHTYGDLAFFRVFTRRLYLVNGPELIRDVLVAKEKSFRKHDRSRKVLGSGFGNGLILSEGPAWLRQRLALQPIFHHQMMEHYAQITVVRTRQLIDAWRGRERVELDHDMTRLALTIIGEALFSADLSERAAHFARLAFELSHLCGRGVQLLRSARLVSAAWQTAEAGDCGGVSWVDAGVDGRAAGSELAAG